MALDCDAIHDGVQALCVYPSGSTFHVQVHVMHAPVNGYVALQAKVAWNDAQLDYVPTASFADAGVWPQCDVSAGIVNRVVGAPSLLAGCVPFPLPEHALDTTGPAFQFTFQCQQDGREPLVLAPARNDAQLGTSFADPVLNTIEAEVRPAEVVCGPCAAGQCPPLQTLGVGEVAVDCNAETDGVQSACAYPVGTRFAIETHITEAPSGGFYGLLGSVRWDWAVMDQPHQIHLSGRLPGGVCGFQDGSVFARYREDGDGPAIAVGCGRDYVSDELSSFIGAFLTLHFQCQQAGTTHVEFEEFYDGTLGYTRFTGVEGWMAPHLRGAVIDCV
jgi:hypothetical protein